VDRTLVLASWRSLVAGVACEAHTGGLIGLREFDAYRSAWTLIGSNSPVRLNKTATNCRSVFISVWRLLRYDSIGESLCPTFG
jgi:hypothetical protein